MKKSRLLSTVLSFVLLSPVLGNAGITTFSDRTIFEVQLGLWIVDTYSETLYHTGDQSTSSTSKSYSNAGMSSVLGETTYQTTGHLPNETNQVTIGYPNNNGNFAYCAGCNGSFLMSYTSTSIGDAQGVYGVGFEIYYNYLLQSDIFPLPPGTLGYHAFVTFGDNSTQDYTLPLAELVTGTATFWGITSDLGIKSIHIGLANGAPTNQSAFIMDNLTIGSPKPPLIGAAPVTYNGTDYQAYYDPMADLTWLTNATVGGLMIWDDAISWAANLSVSGVSGWRLPDTVQPDLSCDTQLNGISFGYNCTGSEMGNMFYNVLGGVAGDPITTTHNSNYYLFSNVASAYWSSTESPFDTSIAFQMNFGGGFQNLAGKGTSNNFAWVVHDGDIRTLIDFDGDGLPDVVEDSNHNGIVDVGETDPQNPDTDNDGALDGQEDTNANGVFDPGEADPLNFDTDGDGLTDGYEINVISTDPSTSTLVYTDPGDMNGDGKVDVGDLLLLQRQILGL